MGSESIPRDLVLVNYFVAGDGQIGSYMTETTPSNVLLELRLRLPRGQMLCTKSTRQGAFNLRATNLWMFADT